MGVTSEMLSSEGAAEFGRRFFEIVRGAPDGSCVRYRDVYDRVVRELPGNAFVVWLAGHPRRRAKLKHVLAAAQEAFPDIERRKDGADHSAQVHYRSRAPAFRIVTGRRAVAAGFATWRRAVMRGGRGVWETSEGLFAVPLPLPGGRTLGRRVALGFDAEEWSWTIEVITGEAGPRHYLDDVLGRVFLGPRVKPERVARVCEILDRRPVEVLQGEIRGFELRIRSIKPARPTDECERVGAGRFEPQDIIYKQEELEAFVGGAGAWTHSSMSAAGLRSARTYRRFWTSMFPGTTRGHCLSGRYIGYEAAETCIISATSIGRCVPCR